MSGVQVPIPVRAEQRQPPLPEADLPGEVVRRDPSNADAEPVDAVQVVCGADGNAVVASVLAAARSVEHVMVAPGHPETLARVVIDPDEPQMLVRATVKEGPGETAKHAATERLLAREAAQRRVEQLGAERAIEPAALLGQRRSEKLGGDDVHEAKIRRKPAPCQLAFQHGEFARRTVPDPDCAEERTSIRARRPLRRATGPSSGN